VRRLPWLIVGGSGTLGQELIPLILENRGRYGISRIRVLSRNEPNQVAMAETLKDQPVDFMIGDVRDVDRVIEASLGCSVVFHLAAFKSVDKAEYDPWEAVLTNVIGTRNVILACKANNVAKAIYTSTDKAVAPVNLYGASKLCGEKLWIAGNIGGLESRFAAVRYGNVLGSNSSVVQRWRATKNHEITDERMTRFFITPKGAAEFVLQAHDRMQGGEVFIPKMKSTTVGELYHAVVGSKGSVKIIGVRPGEKYHEELISKDEVDDVTDGGDCYIRWPSASLFPCERWGDKISSYFNSELCERFTHKEIKEMLK
jgi:UDP-N-acetylglucosamine 4,6-dehydratase